MRIANEVVNNVYPHAWYRRGLPAVNDSQGHTAVLGLFDKALAAA